MERKTIMFDAAKTQQKTTREVLAEVYLRFGRKRLQRNRPDGWIYSFR